MKNVKELFKKYLVAEEQEKEKIKKELVEMGVLTYDGLITREWEKELLPILIF